MSKIFIATPTKWGINPYTHLSFAHNLYTLGRRSDYEIMYPRMYDESPLDEARNVSVQEFLDTDADWFVTYDADQVFPSGTFLRLLLAAEESKQQVVSAWYLGRKGTGTVIVFKRKDDTHLANIANFSEYQPYLIKELLHRPGINTSYGKLVLVDAIGFGLVIIKREVLEKMEYPYFLQWSPAMRGDKYHFGEDLWFCDKLAQLKIPLYVHLKSFIGHWAAQGYIIGDEHLISRAELEGFKDLREAINQ